MVSMFLAVPTQYDLLNCLLDIIRPESISDNYLLDIALFSARLQYNEIFVYLKNIQTADIYVDFSHYF